MLNVFLSLVFTIHLVYGNNNCPNSTKCNVNQVLTMVNNCSLCICRKGNFQHSALAGCKACSVCKFPYVTVQNCTQKSDTKCGLCTKKTHFYTKTGCKKCQQCENGILKPCTIDHNTICVSKSKMTTEPSAKPTCINLTITHNKAENETDITSTCKRNEIWYYLFILESMIFSIFVFIVCIIYTKCCKFKAYAVINETSSLATSSLSSLMLSTRSKWPDINSLTEEERQTLIRDLPGGYAEALGHLLNPNVLNNWVQLAYEFKCTQNQVANLKQKIPEYTQELLFELGSKNITVETLWRALKKIKRDDACVTLVNFVLELRKDNESAIVFVNGI